MEDSIVHSDENAAERDNMFQRLIEIGISLSSERNHNRLLETILIEAKRIANADGGTLYLMADDERALNFAIVRNDTLDISMGGTTDVPIPFGPLALYDDAGMPNFNNVATGGGLNRLTGNIPNAYETIQ